MGSLEWEKGVGPGGKTLDATDQGANPLATSDATFAHAGQELYHLGAVIHGAVTCKLGAAIHGTEIRVHFLKSFQKGRICEILSKKGKKNKKKSRYSSRGLDQGIVLQHILDSSSSHRALAAAAGAG
jgi:hypothetical protein